MVKIAIQKYKNEKLLSNCFFGEKFLFTFIIEILNTFRGRKNHIMNLKYSGSNSAAKNTWPVASSIFPPASSLIILKQFQSSYY